MEKLRIHPLICLKPLPPQTLPTFIVNDGLGFFFFLNQQFITRGAPADHGSYFVTTYIKTESTCEKKKKKKKKRKRKKKFKINTKSCLCSYTQSRTYEKHYSKEKALELN